METLIFILVCYGFCNIMIFGSIFQGWRNLLAKLGTGDYSIHKLFSCFMCLGTWAGIGLSLAMFYYGYGSHTPIGSLGLTNIYAVTLLNGLLSSAGVWLTHTLQESFERAFK